MSESPSAGEDRAFSEADRNRWLHDVLGAFALRTRRDVFLSMARFAHINRPIEGYYFEFGSHGATTMRMAYDAFHHLFDWDYVAFDSFEGMPEIAPIDEAPIWRKGMSKTSEADFVKICHEHGIPPDKLQTVKGFYDQSLTPETASRFADRKAAVVYVDCDLYESTVAVLHFVKPFLQRGTVIVFDDWNCFHGDPERGERRAFREFRESIPDVRFEEFVATGEAQAFICLDET